jgi:hypothetical protein
MATSPTQQKTTNKIILGEKITEARQIIDLNYIREDLPKLIKAMKDGSHRISWQLRSRLLSRSTATGLRCSQNQVRVPSSGFACC